MYYKGYNLILVIQQNVNKFMEDLKVIDISKEDEAKK